MLLSPLFRIQDVGQKTFWVPLFPSFLPPFSSSWTAFSLHWSYSKMYPIKYFFALKIWKQFFKEVIINVEMLAPKNNKDKDYGCVFREAVA